MYESPIEIIQTSTKYTSIFYKEKDSMIFKAVQGVGVNVDKDELLKALKYDRQQYRKGYEDGIRTFTEKLIEELDKRETINGVGQFICNLANETLGYAAFRAVSL